MRTLLKFLLTATVLAGIVGFGGRAQAQDATIRIRSIAATKQANHIDDELAGLAGKLTTAFGGYSRFELINDTQFTLSNSQSHSLTVAGGTEVSVKFDGKAGDFLRLELSIGSKLNTTLKASSGSTFFQAGLDYKSGMLILAITVE